MGAFPRKWIQRAVMVFTTSVAIFAFIAIMTMVAIYFQKCMSTSVGCALGYWFITHVFG